MKKIIGVIMVATTLMGTGCAKSDPNEVKSQEVIVKGNHGDIKLSVKASQNKIVEVKILNHNENEEIADGALTDIPAKIVENNTLKVDTISGATNTSKAILKGVEIALGKMKINTIPFKK